MRPLEHLSKLLTCIKRESVLTDILVFFLSERLRQVILYKNPISDCLSIIRKYHNDKIGLCIVIRIQQNRVFLDETQIITCFKRQMCIEPVHEISINGVCATSKATDQPAHTRSLIRALASHLSFL